MTPRLWMPSDPRRALHRGWITGSEREHATRIAAACFEAEGTGVAVEIVTASCAELEAAARKLGVDPATPEGRAAAVATMPGEAPPRIRPRGRPRNPDPPARVGIKLPTAIRARLERKCRIVGITISEGARRAVVRWLDDDE